MCTQWCESVCKWKNGYCVFRNGRRGVVCVFGCCMSRSVCVCKWKGGYPVCVCMDVVSVCMCKWKDACPFLCECV